MRRYELTDEQWALIQPLLPSSDTGRPRRDDRTVLNAVFSAVDQRREALLGRCLAGCAASASGGGSDTARGKPLTSGPPATATTARSTGFWWPSAWSSTPQVTSTGPPGWSMPRMSALLGSPRGREKGGDWRVGGPSTRPKPGGSDDEAARGVRRGWPAACSTSERRSSPGRDAVRGGMRPR
jgi:hypothetical protein